MSYVIDSVKDRPKIVVPSFKKIASEKAKLAAAKANHIASVKAHYGNEYKNQLNITAPVCVRNSF